MPTNYNLEKEPTVVYSASRTCSKCGSSANAVFCFGKSFGFSRCHDSEHMHRTCTNCRYTWLEKTLEQAAARAAQVDPKSLVEEIKIASSNKGKSRP